jgi:hypothetical protein
LYQNRDKEDLLFTAAKNNIPSVMINFLDMGIRPTEKNAHGVCAMDLIHKNPQLTAAFNRWRRKGVEKSEDDSHLYNTKT